MLVKVGAHASLIEAKTMLYVAEKTSIPVPKLYAAYAYGPIDRSAEKYGSVYDIYIFMEFIEGEDLQKSWEKLSDLEKEKISVDLKQYIAELRAIPSAGYIGSVHNGPVTDVILEYSTTSRGESVPAQMLPSMFLSKTFQGPFKNQDDFNTTLAETYVANRKGVVGPYIRGMLNVQKHSIVFTHGDFRPANIIVKDGHVAAILDWEMAGWYPEYWEFAKAFYVEHFVNDWAARILDILTPYYFEEMMYSKLIKDMW